MTCSKMPIIKNYYYFDNRLLKKLAVILKSISTALSWSNIITKIISVLYYYPLVGHYCNDHQKHSHN